MGDEHGRFDDEKSRRPKRASRGRGRSDNTSAPVRLDAYPFPPNGSPIPVGRSKSDSQDVRNSPIVMRSNDTSLTRSGSRHGFPPPLDLNRSSRRHEVQSPRYDTPLDKSVIWRLAESAPAEGKLGYINDHLQRHGLHTVPDHKGCRILINGKTKERDSGYTQFVGSILSVDDVNGISLLSTMPPIITIDARVLSSVKKHWDDLELMQAEDGATIGLYWYQNHWIIRTAGSFDAGAITWDGRLTFGQMVNDIMEKYPQFRYEVLDTDKCYTFGIKHPAIHAYHEGLDHSIMRAWFIQSADIALINSRSGIFNGSIRFDESIGLPLQRSLDASTFTSMRAVSFSTHQQYSSGAIDDDVRMHVNGNSKAKDDDYSKCGVTLGGILEHTRGALGAVISASSYHDSTVGCPASGYYGIILRSKKYTFFIPSDLYQYIASTYYTNELNDMLGDEQFNRDKFIVLFNALCPTDERKIFTCIYPQYSPMVAKIRDYLNDQFVSVMYSIYDKLNNGVEIDNIYSESTIDLARSLFVVWVRYYGTPKSPERSKIISMFSEYVLDKRNARVLYHDVYASVPWLSLNVNL